jgi:hypothetical protein
MEWEDLWEVLQIIEGFVPAARLFIDLEVMEIDQIRWYAVNGVNNPLHETLLKADS